MLKRLITILSIVLFAVPVLAQQKDSDIPYAPQKGNFQVNLLLGSSSFFRASDFSGYSYLLPSDVQADGTIDDEGVSGDEMRYALNLGNLNENSVTNMIGLSFSCFVSDKLEITAMFGMNINLTPKKDYVEGDYTISEMPIADTKYILGETSHLLNTEIGLNYRFKTRNERISPYIGAVGGFQMARIETSYPYTGEELEGEPIELYRNDYRAGQEYAIRGGVVAGIEFAVYRGLTIGFEVCPAVYQYSVIDIHPTGLTAFRADNHSIKILSQPRLRFGIRF